MVFHALGSRALVEDEVLRLLETPLGRGDYCLRLLEANQASFILNKVFFKIWWHEATLYWFVFIIYIHT